MRRLSPTAAALCLALAAPAARAVDVADGQLSIHGDGQWAYQKTAGRNAYAKATPDGNYDTAMFDLVLTARPAEDLVVSAQLGFGPGESGLEWAFAEWRFSERLRLRVGQVQQPFGNLNELRFAGTTRPFYNLPYSVYGPSNVVGTAYLGVGATGQAAWDSGWSLAWDLYGGAAKVGEAEPYAALSRPGSRSVNEAIAIEDQQVRDLVGTRLSLTAPNELTLRLSGYYGKLVHGESREGFFSTGLSLQYRGERLWLSAEAFLSQEEDGEAAWTVYGTVGFMLTEHLQVAAQHEWARTTFPGSPRSELLRHQAFGLGVAWWVNPSLVFKANWQHVVGNRFAYPEDATPNGLAGSPDPTTVPGRQTDVVTLGTQFAF
jgi:hypothetical protein